MRFAKCWGRRELGLIAEGFRTSRAPQLTEKENREKRPQKIDKKKKKKKGKVNPIRPATREAFQASAFANFPFLRLVNGILLRCSCCPKKINNKRTVHAATSSPALGDPTPRIRTYISCASTESQVCLGLAPAAWP